MKIKLSKVSLSKINKDVVIKTAVGVVAVVGIAGLVTAVSSHWQDQKQIKEAQVTAQRVAAEKQANDTKDKLDRADRITAAYNKVYAECTKGENLYANVLTANQKKLYSKSAPVCGVAEVSKI